MEEIQHDVDAELLVAQKRLEAALKAKEELAQAKLKKALADQQAALVREQEELAERKRQVEENERKWAEKKRQAEEQEIRKQSERRAQAIALETAIIAAEGEKKFREEQRAKVRAAEQAAQIAEQEAAQMLADLSRPTLVRERVDKSTLSQGLEMAAGGLELSAEESQANVRRLLRLPVDYNNPTGSQPPAISSSIVAPPINVIPQVPLVPPIVKSEPAVQSAPQINRQSKVTNFDPNEISAFAKSTKQVLGYELQYQRIELLCAEFGVSG
jgi:chromosome segregation ATPase